ncbi:MAG TPA: diacylglycerol kinase family protein, partial [Mucilaginibacter sp.]|nr:diacylglycerol kinase family protein [Mucilaginibacter sp.]
MNKFIRGFVYAWNGILHAAVTQLNFKVHLGCAIVALYAGYALDISHSEWLWIILCIGMVLVAE